MKNILITGGLGFIGSALTKRLHSKYPEYNLVVVDNNKNQDRLNEIKDEIKLYSYDICEQRMMDKLFELYDFEGVFHLASRKPILNEEYKETEFIKTNILGTTIILNNCVKQKSRLLYTSNTEVYGSLEMDKRTHLYETNCYNPSTPYAASKAAADHIITSYHEKYGLDTLIANISNTYGPGHDKEDFMHVIIDCLLNKQPIPVFGTGENVRDWVYIDDVVDMLDLAYHKGVSGENYNVGGGTLNEFSNVKLINQISRGVTHILNGEETTHRLINHLSDMGGHDLRHSVNYDKSTLRLRWKPNTLIEMGINETIKWHIDKNGINDSI
tara:strand:+ start:586 stop:1566 length:981 start_codon:yes stop_codon:yes gene_type:complete